MVTTIPPGEHLSDTLRELGMSRAELARRMGKPRQVVAELIAGKLPITPETATQLEEATDVPSGVWVRLEATYRKSTVE